jgi:rSAM/selenodomain-associated transferase 1
LKRSGTLILFARAPLLGRVKTRLQPDLSAEEALQLHRALLRDALALLRAAAAHADVAPVVALSEPLAADEPIASDLAGIETVLQMGADLGERLLRAFQDRLRDGGAVVAIGSDSPTLTPEAVANAFKSLRDHDVVIAPAADGGYVLLGCRHLHPEIFQRVPWGTPQVMRETGRRLRKSSIPHAILPAGRDLDTREDLIGIYKELEGAGGPPLAPHTLRALREVLRARPKWIWS